MIATGPSLTLQQVEVARRKGFALTGCNNTWQAIPDLQVLFATNLKWWRYYWSPELEAYPAQKWTTNADAAKAYGLNWIAEKLNDGSGLSTNPAFLYHGHGSGFSLLNLVYLLGARRIVLLGYDLCFAGDYDGRARQVGSTPRHFFGEYPPELQHWPSKMVEQGRHIELLRFYQHVADQRPCEIVNCSGGVLDCFPRMAIEDVE